MALADDFVPQFVPEAERRERRAFEPKQYVVRLGGQGAAFAHPARADGG